MIENMVFIQLLLISGQFVIFAQVLEIMAILGHSQVKHMHEYLVSDKIWTLCYPGLRINQFMDLEIVAEMVPSFPVSTTYIIYRFPLNEGRV